MAPTLLPQEPAPVTRRQARLTARHLQPVREPLEALLLALRAETDATLGARLRPVGDKAYPLGRCQPITDDVAARLRRRVGGGEGPVERAIRGFLAEGGVIRPIWGALRGLYFQNALQFGALYVDVANDTVVVTKPKVEILPMAESGFEAIRGPTHFAEIAERYWGARVFANHALASLAPVLPLVSLMPGGAPRLQSATDFMIDLLCRDGFAAAEAWLAEGPPPPPEVVEDLRARSRRLLAVEPPAAGAEAALAACRQARSAGAQHDQRWRDARIGDYLRLHPPGGAPTLAG